MKDIFLYHLNQLPNSTDSTALKRAVTNLLYDGVKGQRILNSVIQVMWQYNVHKNYEKLEQKLGFKKMKEFTDLVMNPNPTEEQLDSIIVLSKEIIPEL